MEEMKTILGRWREDAVRVACDCLDAVFTSLCLL